MQASLSVCLAAVEYLRLCSILPSILYALIFYSHLITSTSSGEHTVYVFCSLIYICCALSESFPSLLSYPWIIRCWHRTKSLVLFHKGIPVYRHRIMCFKTVSYSHCNFLALVPGYWYFLSRNLTSYGTFGIMLIKEERPTHFPHFHCNRKPSISDFLKLNNRHNFSMYEFCPTFGKNQQFWMTAFQEMWKEEATWEYLGLTVWIHHSLELKNFSAEGFIIQFV